MVVKCCEFELLGDLFLCIKKWHLVMRHAQAWNEALKERQAVYLDPFQEHLNFHVLM